VIPPAEAAPGSLLFESVARPLLLLHATLGFTAVGTTTHHAVYSWLAACGQRRTAALQRFGWLAPLAVLSQVLLGLVLYPTYRVRVRALHFDHENPVVAQLFDFKEHLAALSVALVVGAALVARLRPDDAAGAQGGQVAKATAALSITGAALVWTVALIGLYVTAVRPVGMP
jgi:hypothetical protein